MKRVLTNLLVATTFLALAGPSVAGENLKFNFYQAGEHIGGVPITDDTTGRCYRGGFEYLGKFCSIDMYICEMNVDKFADLNARATYGEIISLDRSGYPTICK